MATARVLPIPEHAPKPRTVATSKPAPKPSTIDQAARNWLALKLEEESLEQRMSAARQELLRMIEEHGSVPPKAEKSKRLCGEVYYVNASYGTSTSIDTQAAERVMLAMIESGMEQSQARTLFESLFTFSPKYSLASTAMKVIAGKLPKGCPRNLRHLFGQALKITHRAPSINVEEIGG